MSSVYFPFFRDGRVYVETLLDYRVYRVVPCPPQQIRSHPKQTGTPSLPPPEHSTAENSKKRDSYNVVSF